MWNTVEVEEMIADNSSGFGHMNGLVADEAGGIIFMIVFKMKQVELFSRYSFCFQLCKRCKKSVYQ